MSLQTAFYSARSALAVNSAQTSTVSRNIAGASETGYARRLLLVETNGNGEVRAGSVERATNLALSEAMLSATSSSAANDAVSSALSSLQQTVGDPQSAQSPAALAGALQNALTQAAAAPQDPASVGAAVDAAKALATALNNDSAQVQATRLQADGAMTQSVATINSLLGEFGNVNAQIVSGRQSGADVSDATDRRDAILSDLAGQIGIRTVANANGDTAIYTDSGVPLFQDGARTVTMNATQTFTAGVAGAAVFVDGVAVAGGSTTMPTKSGALAGLAQIRDVSAPAYQAQLDEIARGLVGAFAQTDQTGSSAPARTGVFTWSGSPALPSGPTAGLATQIGVDPTVDPSSGGDPTLLRDGGVGAGSVQAYVYNSSRAASFTDRLTGLSDTMNASQSFDPKSGLPTKSSVMDLATNSVAWLEAARKDASDASTQSSAIAAQATSALGNATGVNIDDQMSQMLDLENSYQASAKMMATVDTMYSALFTAMTVTT